MTSSARSQLVSLTADIVAAYVRHNPAVPAELPFLIRSVHRSLWTVGAPSQPPAVPVRSSIADDYLVCLEDGRRFKSLKRHLKAEYDLTPEAYRAKWGLASTYPMVAPAYAAERSALAKRIGLGRATRPHQPRLGEA